jgi:hypothetical protein
VTENARAAQPSGSGVSGARPTVAQAKAALRECASRADEALAAPLSKNLGWIGAGLGLASLLLARPLTLSNLAAKAIRLVPDLMKFVKM